MTGSKISYPTISLKPEEVNEFIENVIKPTHEFVFKYKYWQKILEKAKKEMTKK